MSYERLAAAARLAGNTAGRERWTAEEWLALHAAYEACGHDLTPDRWTPGQVALALALGVPPSFAEDGSPLAPPSLAAETRRVATCVRSVVADDMMRTLVIERATEAYMLEQWRAFSGWAGLLDEAGRTRLAKELFVP